MAADHPSILRIRCTMRERHGAPHSSPIDIATAVNATNSNAVREPLKMVAVATDPIARNITLRCALFDCSRKYPAVPENNVAANVRYSAKRPGLTKIEFGSESTSPDI